jgi:sugar phosphate isomerase/epimerase
VSPSEAGSGAAPAASAPGLRRPACRRRGAAGWRRLLTSAGLALAVTAGACRPIDPNEDTRIEAEIKARLVAEKFANLTRLGVLSRAGVVYLSGTVASLDERARAEALSRDVRGVGRVVNTLEVQPE